MSGKLEIATEFNDFFVKIGDNIGNNEEGTEEYSQYLKNKPNYKLCLNR